MTRREKALARLLDDSGARDRGWKTYEELDEALSAIGWIQTPGRSTHRSAWAHPRSDLILHASLQRDAISPVYIRKIRKDLLDFCDSDAFDENSFPELHAYLKEGDDHE